ncbi:MoxR family ATPase [Luteolibacter ambystomatis]|uniref:MoxR family ATPase n=1 Tax=Luteolibacter ambystomatis TaxID=2824561 RepID=A0A975PFI2_9BACT|nr:MoxR family ATPase [Luteolibacter ambystomatis]QUE51910.1 MoxR family ATPase [Luteolibacter ambystomatis]
MPQTLTPPAPTDGAQPEIDPKVIEDCRLLNEAIQQELGKVIVGQKGVISEILISILTRSHALLVGVPGLAKTLLISTLADTLHLSFRRIQFTPDLMPSDITGTEVIHHDPVTNEKQFKFHPGPLFSNIVLADEINRTPPKTQAAMLEAMQERRVTVGGVTRDLPVPFFVLATQNPLEQEGTYPLPEAQLDRFMFLIHVGYPSAEEELEVMKRGTGAKSQKPQAVLDGEAILRMQETVKALPVADHVFHYALKIVRATRPKEEGALPDCERYLAFGAGPRASLSLIMAAKAHALLNGQLYVGCADVAAVAPSILRHRIAVNFSAQSEGITSDEIISRVLKAIPQHER